MTLSDRLLRTPARPLVLGHRGARHRVQENTLAAFEAARQEGAEGSELDIQLTKDRVPVVMHDLNLARVTGGRDTRCVKALTWTALRDVRLDGDHAVPSLEQTLRWALAHDQVLNIELKTDGAAADPVGDVVAELVQDFPALHNQLIISSFHPRLLLRFKQRSPKLPVAFLYTQSHPRWPSSPLVRSLEPAALHPQASLADGAQPLTEPSGSPLNVWTVNDPEQAARLSARGVNAIISDNPGKILAGLQH